LGFHQFPGRARHSAGVPGPGVGSVVLPPAPAAVIGVGVLVGKLHVAAAEVEQRDRRLDQPLVEALLRTATVRPQLLPDVVRLEEVAGVEQQDARQVTRVVRLHGGILSGPPFIGIGPAGGGLPADHRESSRRGFLGERRPVRTSRCCCCGRSHSWNTIRLQLGGSR